MENDGDTEVREAGSELRKCSGQVAQDVQHVLRGVIESCIE